MSYPDPSDMPESGIPQPSTEVVPAAPAIIPHPKTGEAIELVASTPTDALADTRDRLVEYEGQIKIWKTQIDGELVQRLDYEGRASAEVRGTYGAFKITVPKGTKTTWDAREAYVQLRRLVRDGIISKDRMDEAVQRTTSYKAAHGSLKQLEAHSDERVRAAVAACKEVVPQERRASISRRYDVGDAN